jgi:hypothetical protein
VQTVRDVDFSLVGLVVHVDCFVACRWLLALAVALHVAVLCWCWGSPTGALQALMTDANLQVCVAVLAGLLPLAFYSLGGSSDRNGNPGRVHVGQLPTGGDALAQLADRVTTQLHATEAPVQPTKAHPVAVAVAAPMPAPNDGVLTNATVSDAPSARDE